MTERKAGPRHEALYQELTAVIRKYSDNLSPIEILAITSNMVGKVLAMQDQRKTTRDAAVKTMAMNIELGNAQMIEELKAAPTGKEN